jgi:hypothetical protein
MFEAPAKGRPMADETTQTGEETSWWDLDIFADSELPSTSFDEPLEWPETLDWGDYSEGDGDLQFPGIGDMESGPIFPPIPDPAPTAPAAAAEQPATSDGAGAGAGGDPTMPHITVLSGLGGTPSGARAARAVDQTPSERLPDSLWAGGGDGNGVGPAATTTAAPTFSAEGDDGGGWRRRFDIRHGNAAVIALISFVSLILLGMFMSVRARNQLPDTSQTRTTSDQIQVQGTLNTVPLTTSVTTTPPAINIADLVPPTPEDTTTVTAGGSTGSGTTSAPVATAAPRSTPAAGGGTGTTQPAAQPTNTTAAPQTTAPPETTSPPATSSPPPDTTDTTRPRFPTTPTTATTPTTEYTVPTFPPDFDITVPTAPRRFG